MRLESQADNEREPFIWALPSRSKFFLYLRLNLFLSVLFGAIYGLTNLLARERGGTTALYAQWEVGIPLVPAAILVYFSIVVLFWLPLFILGAKHLRLLARQFAIATIAAGAVFALLPAKLGFEREAPSGAFQQIFSLLHQLDQPFNTLPSLHVAYSTLMLGTLNIALPGARLIWFGWWCAICVSVVLVHQHHLADVVAGTVLGIVLLRRMRVELTPSICPATS